MTLFEILRQSLESLRGNKLRSFLTMLGIIMGVFSIIAIVATGNAIKVYVNTEFEKIGSNTVVVQTRNDGPVDSLTMADVDIIRDAIPDLKNVAPYYTGSGGTVRIDTKTRRLLFNGVVPVSREQSSIEIMDGRYITESDVKTRAKVCLISATTAYQVYRRTGEVGEKFSFRARTGETVSLTVVGIIESQIDTLTSMFGDEAPVPIHMPITTAMELAGNRDVSEIRLVMPESDMLREAGVQAVKALEFVHGVEQAYAAASSDDVLTQLNNILGMIQIALGIIAAVTLAVGGIGIVNILLVSVTERTREIGVRKALGAKRRDIVWQFVAEAVLMTGFSGIIGIAMGVGAGSVISAVIDIPPVVDLPTVILAFLFSLVLGLGFGVYPAKRAADLDPIESLRYE
jgi:putative ABC transport system permease protein